MARQVTLSRFRVASTKQRKDAGSGHSSAMGATEDAAMRRVIAGRNRTCVAWRATYAAETASASSRGSRRDTICETPSPPIVTPYRTSAASIVRF